MRYVKQFFFQASMPLFLDVVLQGGAGLSQRYSRVWVVVNIGVSVAG